MFDLFVFFDGKSYYNRNELKARLGLDQQQKPNGEEIYSKKERDSHFLIEFSNDLNDYSYSEDEINRIPYNVCGLCHIVFYPFDFIYDLLSVLIGFNDDLFVDDDHDNILSVCDYKDLLHNKKVYPFTYL